MPALESVESKARYPSRLLHLVAFVVITGTLYFGREVLIPLALAVLLSFLLAPAVRLLERWKLPRILSTTVVTGCAFAIIGGVLLVASMQLLALAGSLPEYKDNIRNKIRVLQSEGNLSKASRALDEIGVELAAELHAKRVRAGRVAEPLRVNLAETRTTPFEMILSLGAPLVAPLGTAAAVIIFTFVMLLQREDLRNRVIRLIGQGQLSTTTQAFEDAAKRVSSYLRMQLIVNLSYGLPVGIGLYLIGVPNAALWGMLAVVLRFVPYLGPMVAAALPVALAFAISKNWSLVLWTLSLFVVLELVSNNIIEPWLYGPSTGLSAIALMVAAIFWTWLWGAVGLLLATPLTVCLVVMGRYVPQLSFLQIMLGDEPVLNSPTRIYQRLLALDWSEAVGVAESHIDEHGVPSLYDEVLIPVLDLLEADRQAEALSADRERFVFDSLRRLLEDAPERMIKTANGERVPALNLRTTIGLSSVCIMPARQELDELVGLMLQQLLNVAEVDAEMFPGSMTVGELLGRVEQIKPHAVCIVLFAPSSVLHAAVLCKRLRARFAELKIVVALWQAPGSSSKLEDRLRSAGASEVLTTLKTSVEHLKALAGPLRRVDDVVDAAA